MYLIIFAKALFPHKVSFWDSRCMWTGGEGKDNPPTNMVWSTCQSRQCTWHLPPAMKTLKHKSWQLLYFFLANMIHSVSIGWRWSSTIRGRKFWEIPVLLSWYSTELPHTASLKCFVLFCFLSREMTWWKYCFKKCWFGSREESGRKKDQRY